MMIRRIAGVVAACAVLLPIAAWGRQVDVDAAANAQPPERVLDTRDGLGAARQLVVPGQVLELRSSDIRVQGETVALLNLTADGAQQDGHVKAWPCGQPEPDTSVLNYVVGRAVPNMLAVGYTNAGICLSVSSPVNLIADLTGSTTDGDLHGISPQRIVDTRQAQRYGANREYRVRVAGTPGINNDAVLAAINVTVVQPVADGYVSVSPCDATDASTINFRRGETVAHMTFSALGGGDVCISSSADTHMLIDTFGWASASSEIGALNPDRALDTRSGEGGVSGAIANGQLVRLRLAGRHGVPNTADGVAVNVAALDGRGDGYVKAWPCDEGEPGVSTLNLWNGVLWANQAVLKLSQSGELCLRPVTYNGTSLDMLVDVVGYVAGTVQRADPPAVLPRVTPVGTQFVETFDNNTGGDRFDYWVYHRNIDRYGESYGYSYGNWNGDHDNNCNGPDTQRPLSFNPGDNQARRVSQSVYVCKNHMMTSMGDVEAYSIVTFSPKQVFPSVSSVCFDVNLTDLGNAQWWKVGVVSEAKYNSIRRDGGLYDVPGFMAADVEASGVEASLATNDMLVATWAGGVSAGWPGGLKIGNTPSNVMSNPAPNDVATRFPVCLEDNGNNTVTFTVAGSSFTTAGSFPAGRARVVFYDNSYEPDQTCIYANTNCSGGEVVHTSWHWDNIAVS